MNRLPSAQEWFESGERIAYDSQAKRIVNANDVVDLATSLQVFKRIERSPSTKPATKWISFLPGFPDGSFGWARVELLLKGEVDLPQLFVEYVGQGDSDKPADYPYSTMERADLVEALWRSHGIESNFIVSFDYSALVTLELLSRQLDRDEKGVESSHRIDRVLLINGGLFADGHSHPWFTTPLLKTPIGKMGTWFAQRSKVVFKQMVDVLWSKQYKVTAKELNQVFDAITRRNGAAFMSNGAGFVDEHQKNSERWDLRKIYLATSDSVSFHIVGSEEDPFEANQITLAKQRLGDHGLDVRVLPGGHLTTSEHPELLAGIIKELAQST